MLKGCGGWEAKSHSLSHMGIMKTKTHLGQTQIKQLKMTLEVEDNLVELRWPAILALEAQMLGKIEGISETLTWGGWRDKQRATVIFHHHPIRGKQIFWAKDKNSSQEIFQGLGKP